jgi:hypothetical protein
MFDSRIDDAVAYRHRFCKRLSVDTMCVAHLDPIKEELMNPIQKICRTTKETANREWKTLKCLLATRAAQEMKADVSDYEQT